MAREFQSMVSSPPVVAVAGWVVPGAGYLLIGQRTRGITVGVTILLLFGLGLLIAGVRVVEVPGYDPATGERQMYTFRRVEGGPVLRDWILTAAPMAELRNKPWSVPQIMTGPVAVAAGAWSVYAAGPDTSKSNYVAGSRNNDPIGYPSHARIADIGSLYLSVAGLLNLMAIIDSAHRASRLRPAGVTGGAA